jgi:hypothetical protein
MGVILTAVALACAGCVKIRLTVKLNEDGSGQVVEDIVFSRMMVDASKRIKDSPGIDGLTSDEHVRGRMAHMGKGVSLVDKKVEQQADGSLRLLTTYAFEDINDLKLAPLPYGPGWEDLHMAFEYEADTSLAAEYRLNVEFRTPEGKNRQHYDRPELPPLSEREAQQVRQLLPVFKDMVEGFELKLALEIYGPKVWATTTKGHMPSGGYNPFAAQGGRVTLFQITDKHLRASDDGLIIVAPWRQIGREFDLYHHDYPPGPRLLPHVNIIDRGGYRFRWRAIQTPTGREYY